MQDGDRGLPLTGRWHGAAKTAPSLGYKLPAGPGYRASDMGSGGASRGLGGREEERRLWLPHWNPVRAETASLDAGQPYQERRMIPSFSKILYRCVSLIHTLYM